MAAFNFLRGTQKGPMAFYQSKRTGIPHTVVFPKGGARMYAKNFDVLMIKPRVGNQLKADIQQAQRLGATTDEVSQLFLKLWTEILPYMAHGGEDMLEGLVMSGTLPQVFPNIFSVLTNVSRPALYQRLVTQGFDSAHWNRYFGELPQQDLESQGEKINNAVIFFPPQMQPARKKKLIQFLDSAYDVLKQNGLGNLFGGRITFAKLEASRGGDWDKRTGEMRVQPNTQDDKTNFFTILHEYGHKYWDTMMTSEEQEAVRSKYIELVRGGVGYEKGVSKLDQLSKAAEEIVQPGIQVQWVGRKGKFSGTWEVTNVRRDIGMRGGKYEALVKYDAKPIKDVDGNPVVRGPNMHGPVEALLDTKRWKILNPPSGMDVPTLDTREHKADIVTDKWFPTQYSESKPGEWWAEMFGVHMLGNLKGEPAEFMNGILRR